LEDLKSVSFTLNLISNATIPIRPYPIKIKVPDPVNKGKELELIPLIRIDLRHYAPQDKDLQRWLKIWEEYQFDPKFNFLITEDTLKFAQNFDNNLLKIEDFNKIPSELLKNQVINRNNQVKKVKKRVEKTWLGDIDPDDGKYYPKGYKYHVIEEVDEPIENQTNILRIISNHIDKQLIATAIDLTHSQAPIVNYKYFIRRALTTIQGKGVFNTVYRGLYYDFLGIKAKKVDDKDRKKGSDEDVFLENLGIGNVEN